MAYRANVYRCVVLGLAGQALRHSGESVVGCLLLTAANLLTRFTAEHLSVFLAAHAADPKPPGLISAGSRRLLARQCRERDRRDLVHCLHVVADEQRVHGDAVRAVRHTLEPSGEEPRQPMGQDRRRDSVMRPFFVYTAAVGLPALLLSSGCCGSNVFTVQHSCATVQFSPRC